MNIAAIDIGSNAIRLVIATYNKNESHHHVIHKYRAPLRLGSDVFTEGKISKENLTKLIQIFKLFQKVLLKHQVTHYFAAATSALRESSNRSLIINQIYKKTHIKIQLIDGLQEAKYIFSAVRNQIDLLPHQALLIDIGGGSVELTFAIKGKPTATKSFSLGTVRLLEILKKNKFKESDLPFLLFDFIPEVQKFLTAHRPKNLAPLCVIGTGGNVEAMGKLKVKLLGKLPASAMTLAELNQIILAIRKVPLRQRSVKLGLRQDRADVILPAMLVIKLIMLQSQAQKLVIPYVGLKDGLLNILTYNIGKKGGPLSQSKPSKSQATKISLKPILQEALRKVSYSK